jgi:ABC-2 type transport system ATP-binding protein
MLRVEKLVKHFDEVHAVDNISFTVNRGEIVGFLGPNGAGKTTTMKIITGYLAPTAGNVFIDDKNVLEYPIECKAKIGYVPESFPVYDDMIVYDYLRFVANIHHIPADRVDARILDVGTLCGLQSVIGRVIGELSKGYRQRVGLAQALIHEPEILILDEPTDGLDPNQKVEIRNLIHEIGKTRTILLSTHNLPEVQIVCNRVMIIAEGKIVAEGTPEELGSKSAGNNVLAIELDKNYSDALERLRSIEGVSSVNFGPKEGATFVVEYKKEADIRPMIFKLAMDNNWTLVEMRKEQASLEDIFQRLTQA